MGNYLSVYAALDDKHVDMMRRDFREEMKAKIQEEKEYCEKTGAEPMMTPLKQAEIERLTSKAMTMWHIEALRRLVLHAMIVPTEKEIDEKAWMLSDEALKT